MCSELHLLTRFDDVYTQALLEQRKFLDLYALGRKGNDVRASQRTRSLQNNQ